MNKQDNVPHEAALERIQRATEIIKEASDLLRQADSTYTSWDDQHDSVQQMIIGAMLDFSNEESKVNSCVLKDNVPQVKEWIEVLNYCHNGREINLKDIRMSMIGYKDQYVIPLKNEITELKQLLKKVLLTYRIGENDAKKIEQALNSKEVGGE